MLHLLVFTLQEFGVDKLHDLQKKGVAGDEADIERQGIVWLLDRDYSRVLDD